MLTLASVMRSEMKKRKLEFSSHPGNLALMRNFVRHFLDNMPISERDRTLMVLGVDEACTNIIRHAYELRDDKLIALSLEIRDANLIGLWHARNVVRPPSARVRPRERSRQCASAGPVPTRGDRTRGRISTPM